MKTLEVNRISELEYKISEHSLPPSDNFGAPWSARTGTKNPEKNVYPSQRKHLPQTNKMLTLCEGIPLNLETVVAILVISVAVLTYAKHPLATSQQDSRKETTKV